MRIGGLASGMDIDQMVKDLMSAERIPVDKLAQEKQLTEWKRDDYREINKAISEFRDAASKLRLQSTFNAYKMNSSNESAVSAKATGSTMPGTYNVTVTTTAKAAKYNSDNAITNQSGNPAKASDKVLGTGLSDSFKITNTKGQQATIMIDDTDTYESLAKKIAGAVDDTSGESLGIRANFDNTTSRFFIATKELGGDKDFTLENNSFVNTHIAGSTNTINETGVYGEIDFDGITVQNLTSNNVTVNGINLTLHKEGETASISVESDTASPLEAIKDFVTKYNELLEKVEKEVYEPRYKDYPPLTEEQRSTLSEREVELWDEKAKSGMLHNDRLLRETLTDFRRALLDPVDGIASGEVSMLASIGINTGNYQERGKLFIDEEKLTQALQDKPDEVMALFTKNDADGKGIGQRLYEDVNANIKKLSDRAGSPTGTLFDNSTLSKNLRDMDKEMDRWEERLAQIEDRYWRQFTAMEKAMDKMNQQSMWMQQNLFGGM